jgi:hypothetical protein
MRDSDEAALVAGCGDRLGGRQAGRDRPLEERADEVAVAGLHLLADDDRKARGNRRREIARLERSLDPVMVGDRDVGQSAGRSGPDDRRR